MLAAPTAVSGLTKQEALLLSKKSASILEEIVYNSATTGPLAHLVERIHGMDEVRSSSLLGSTTVDIAKATFLWLSLCLASKLLCLRTTMEGKG
jgi:hypothetical protein